MSKKKNQHYVPQFYLKNFSNNGDRKSIQVFNPSKELFISSASIKNQSSKNLFYGKDHSVDDVLTQMEGILAPKIASISKGDTPPDKYSDEHIALLIFMVLNDLRNPVQIEQIKGMSSLTNREINRSRDVKQQTFPDISHETAIRILFSQYDRILKICMDLDFKLLINNTNNPFLTCDFPSIKYNQFLEKKMTYGSNTGYATTGLQLFLPVTPEKCFLFFDPTIYRVGNKKDLSVELPEEDVDQINTLQILNCWQNIYSNEKANETYIRKINERSKKYIKANELGATSHDVIREKEVKENEQIIHVRSTDLLINLKLSKIKLTRRANSIDLGNKISPMRAKAKQIVDEII